MNIRPILPTDIEAFARLLQNLDFNRVNSWSHETLLTRIRTVMNLVLAGSGSCYVAEENQTLVGFVNVHWLPYFILGGVEGYVSELFVLDEFRGRSVGTLLMEKVENEAKLRGCDRLNLLNSQLRVSYQRRFYEKIGYHEREDFKNFVKYLS